MAYYKDGWHQAKNSTLNFYVENGYVIRGTMGENIDYKPVYPYYYNKKLKCYEKKKRKYNYDRKSRRLYYTKEKQYLY